jgi:hypothetical protein
MSDDIQRILNNVYANVTQTYGPIANFLSISNFHSLRLNEIKVDKFTIINSMDIGQVTKDYRNVSLDSLANRNVTILFDQYMLPEIQSNYQNITFLFDAKFHNDSMLRDYMGLSGLVEQHRNIEFTNFVSCFAHGQSIVRQCLTSSLYKLKMWKDGYCTKYFISPRDQIDGNISLFCGNEISERFYRKFIIDDSVAEDKFYTRLITNPVQVSQTGRLGNVPLMLDKILPSFISIVSESLAESYQPYYTEKFLFPTIARSLWVASAQPNWHYYLTKHYGFKLFDKIFNYDFDKISNPIERTVALVSMLSKFQNLSQDDWIDLYRIEQDTIDFNHDHYYSGKYLDQLIEVVG